MRMLKIDILVAAGFALFLVACKPAEGPTSNKDGKDGRTIAEVDLNQLSRKSYSTDAVDVTDSFLKKIQTTNVIKLPCGPLLISGVRLERDILIQSGCEIGPTIVYAPRKNLVNYNVFHSSDPITIEIQGLVFDGGWKSGKGDGGQPILDFAGVKSIAIRNSEFKNLSQVLGSVPKNIWQRNNSLINIVDAQRVLIEGNSIHDLYKYEVISIKSKKKITDAIVRGNKFYDLRGANSPVNAFNLKSIVISKNEVSNIKSSAFNVFSENATIDNNRLVNLQTAGIDMHEGLFHSHGAKILNNVVENCGLRGEGASSGIIVSGSNSVVSGNAVRNCEAGIVVYNNLSADLVGLGISSTPQAITNVLIEKNELMANRVVNLRIQSMTGHLISAVIQNNRIGISGHSTLWNIDLNLVGTVRILSNIFEGTGRASLNVRNDFYDLVISGNAFSTVRGDTGHYAAFIGRENNYTIGQFLNISGNKFQADLSATSYDLYSNGFLSVKKEFSGSDNHGADAVTKPFNLLQP